jgi:hypothetical protein
MNEKLDKILTEVVENIWLDEITNLKDDEIFTDNHYISDNLNIFVISDTSNTDTWLDISLEDKDGNLIDSQDTTGLSKEAFLVAIKDLLIRNEKLIVQ